MEVRKLIFCVGAILLLSCQVVKSQQFLSPTELENFLDEAERQARNYGKVFQNLSAEEIKTKFYYERDGSLKDKRTIKSIFVVYQSPNTKITQEFRNVYEYNGKNVSRNDRETAAFFEKLARAETSAEEFQKIKKESLRYDGNRISWGMTLDQPRPFSENLRANFKFQIVGKERIENRDVWVIEYEQTEPSPFIVSSPTDEERKRRVGGTEYSVPISDVFRPTKPLMNGKLRLDAETARIWRNEFKIVLHPAKLSNPVTAVESSYEYQSSEFGILTPKRISVRSYAVKGTGDKDLSVTKDSESIYEYSKFSEFKTETKNYKIEN